MDMTSLYINILHGQKERIGTVSKTFNSLCKDSPPIPTPKLILQENTLEFNGENYLQLYETAMGTKMAVPRLSPLSSYGGGRNRLTKALLNHLLNLAHNLAVCTYLSELHSPE